MPFNDSTRGVIQDVLPTDTENADFPVQIANIVNAIEPNLVLKATTVATANATLTPIVEGMLLVTTTCPRRSTSARAGAWVKIWPTSYSGTAAPTSARSASTVTSTSSTHEHPDQGRRQLEDRHPAVGQGRHRLSARRRRSGSRSTAPGSRPGRCSPTRRLAGGHDGLPQRPHRDRRRLDCIRSVARRPPSTSSTSRSGPRRRARSPTRTRSR